MMLFESFHRLSHYGLYKPLYHALKIWEGHAWCFWVFLFCLVFYTLVGILNLYFI